MSTLFNKRVIVGEIGGKKEVSPDHVFQGKLVKCVLGAFFSILGLMTIMVQYCTLCIRLCVCVSVCVVM